MLPTESQEAVILVAWLRLRGLKFHHSPNETGHSAEARRRAARVKREGTSAGFPDYLICIPPDRSRSGRGHLLVIELKRQKGGTVSPAQREWIASFNDLASPDVDAYVARGADHAIDLVSDYLA